MHVFPSSRSSFDARVMFAAIGVGLLSACATPTPTISASPAPAVATVLQAPGNQRVAFTWHAIGSQIYECRANGQGGWAWLFVAPEADLFNEREQKVGSHGAGPSWTAMDGSKALGTIKARAAGQRPTDIPLLLLATTSAGPAGKMASITSVQRLNTEGGNAPATGCQAASDAGKRVKEGYTADYVFFALK